MGCASSSLKDSAVAPSKEDEVYHTTTDSKRSSLETFPSVSTDPSSPSSSAVVHVGTSDDVNNEKEKEWGEELEVDGGSSEQQAASLGSASHSVHTSDVGMKPKVKALPASAPAMPFRIRKATSSVSGTGTGTGPSMDTDKGTATGVEVEEEAYLGPIRLIHLEDFANYGSVPRYPKCMQTKGTCETTKGQSMVFDIHDPDASQHFDRSKSFIVFISHCWLAGWDGCVAGKGVGSSYEDSLVPSDHTQRVLVSPEHADQWRGFPHPDNKNDDKYRLICEGVRNVWQTQAAGMKDCYLWMDYSCINQDGDPAGELLYLDQLVANADCLFTPIVDPEWTKWRSAGHQDLTTKERGKMGNSVSNINILISSSDDIGLLERSTVAPPSEVAAHDCFVQDWFQSYNAPAFRAPKFGYLERAWCRVEMLFASNLPISEVSPISHTSIVSKVKTENNTCKHAELKRRQTEVSQLEVASQGSGDYFEAEGGGVPGVMSASKTALVDAVNRAQMLELARRENFSSGLQRIAANGWRPQFLYGTMEQELGLPAKVMPPLSYTFVEKFNPVLGGLSVESDRDKIKVFLNELEPFIAKAKTVYKGERDTDTNLKSGSGQIVYEDGSTFEGTFNANQREGYGTFTWIQGSQYKGNYSNNLRNGYGELETASGRVYKGAWRDNLMEGQGHLVTQHEDFMGELKANCFVKGVLSFKTGDVYEGKL